MWQKKRGNVHTYSAVLDAPHSAHGGKATDERAALLLQAVRFHLGSGQNITISQSIQVMNSAVSTNYFFLFDCNFILDLFVGLRNNTSLKVQMHICELLMDSFT